MRSESRQVLISVNLFNWLKFTNSVDWFTIMIGSTGFVRLIN